MSEAFDRMLAFLRGEMRMSHIYQPLMVRTLLRNGHTASTRELASAFLSHDESQLEYYEAVVNRMPGPVLQRHGIVEKITGGYRLPERLQAFTEDERVALIAVCDEAISNYITARGSSIWEHRASGLGRIPGGLRYETFKRAGFRCELCGVSADERALDVDHILPRKAGGTDVIENFQALCWQCNTSKGAGDDTDFRGVRSIYDERKADCIFCTVPADRIVAENTLAYAIRDRFPVTDLHTLVIPKRHAADYFHLYASEERAMHLLLRACRATIAQSDTTVSGFNVGINAGQAAGQTVLHCHVHLIPRRTGDVARPRGGVRGVIPGKADYADDAGH